MRRADCEAHYHVISSSLLLLANASTHSLPDPPLVPPFHESYKQDDEFLNIATDSNRSGSCGVQWSAFKVTRVTAMAVFHKLLTITFQFQGTLSYTFTATCFGSHELKTSKENYDVYHIKHSLSNSYFCRCYISRNH